MQMAHLTDVVWLSTGCLPLFYKGLDMAKALLELRPTKMILLTSLEKRFLTPLQSASAIQEAHENRAPIHPTAEVLLRQELD